MHTCTEFQSILAFRQQHRLTNSFQISDLYFICRMKPLTFNIHPCQDEVLKCRWMKLQDLAVSLEATPLSHRISKMVLERRSRKEEGERSEYDFKSLDIGMEEWELNFPKFSLNRSYKLFLRTPMTPK